VVPERTWYMGICDGEGVVPVYLIGGWPLGRPCRWLAGRGSGSGAAMRCVLWPPQQGDV
jgi:hypothetical protein